VNHFLQFVVNIIRKYVLQQTKPVIIIGHSKGGVDTTVALSLFPELVPHIRGVITIQSPFGGSPIATDFCQSPSSARFFSGALRAIMGDPKSMDQLTYQYRKSFMESHQYPIESVPTLCFASCTGNSFSVLRPFTNYILDRYQEPNDGMVCVCDAILPGSLSVTIDNLDHGEMVIATSPLTKYSKTRIIDALLSLLFQNSPERSLDGLETIIQLNETMEE